MKNKKNRMIKNLFSTKPFDTRMVKNLFSDRRFSGSHSTFCIFHFSLIFSLFHHNPAGDLPLDEIIKQPSLLHLNGSKNFFAAGVFFKNLEFVL